MRKFLDVSKYQPSIDYKKVKASGIEGVILRCGITYWGEQVMDKDPYFERHYKGFQEAGLPIGAYYFSAADSVEVAKKEAEYCKTAEGTCEIRAKLSRTRANLFSVKKGNNLGA